MVLNELLARADSLRDQINALRPFDPDQEARLVQKLNLEWNYHSNAIEGNTLTLGETRAFLLYGITAQGKPFRDYLDIKGHQEAIRFLVEMVRGGEVLTEAVIREFHRILLVEAYDVDAITPNGRPTRRRIALGQYKTAPNHVRTTTGETHFYATPQETPALMGELMAWYRRAASPGVGRHIPLPFCRHPPLRRRQRPHGPAADQPHPHAARLRAGDHSA